MGRAWRGRGLLLALAIAATAAGCQRSARVAVRSFTASAVVLPNSDVDLTEEIRVALPPNADASFTRVVRNDQSDALELRGVAVDGRVPTAGVGVEVSATDGRTLRVAIRFDGSGPRDRLISIQYTAVHAVAVIGARGRLRWPILPDRRGYDVSAASFALRLPDGASFLSTPGIAEPGWDVHVEGAQLIAAKGEVGDTSAATAVVEFTLERGRIAEPLWQVRGQLARELVPAFASAGLFFLVIGAGVVWIVRFQFPRIPRRDRETDAGRRAAADPERRRAAAGLWTSALVCLVTAGAVAAAIEMTMAQYGLWAHAIPASIAVVGAMLFVQSRRL